jgi:pimeloyl-ACP methyl ester carboxylesterase
LKKGIISGILLLLSLVSTASKVILPHIYLLSGQGSDERVFSKLNLDSSFTYTYIPYHIPKKGATMSSYAHELVQKIDTTEPFILVGVSLGGMLSMEIAKIVSPELVVLISSAKVPEELPKRYRKASKTGIQNWVPPALIKRSAFLLQPIFEPDRKKEKEICISMLADKDKVFLKRSAAMISEWDSDTLPHQNVFHIHGSKDHTIPIKNVQANYIVPEGSHMMVLVQPEEVSAILNRILKPYKTQN